MRTTVFVKLEIDGEAEDAFEVVDRILDGGVFQDAINEHDVDCGEVHVKVAVCGGASHAEEWLREMAH